MDKQYTKEIVISIAATVLMLVCGYLSELIPKHKWQYFGLGFVFLFVLGFALYKVHKDKLKKDDKYKKVPKWPWIFIIIWVLYGLAYLSKSRDLFYNILDLAAKGLFAFIIGIN